VKLPREARPLKEYGIAGTPLSHISESEIITTSHASFSLFSSKNCGRLGLPISSSPSMQNLRLTGNVFSNFCSASTALICKIVCPLSSVAPLAKIFSSRMWGSNGGVSHK
jgi:hypothetical protein